MWMKKDENRTIFQALSPVNLEYERMPNQPYKVDEQPVLTFVARQKGEAWNHPFVTVYEPSSDTEPGDLASVDFFEPEQKGAVGILVKLKDGTTQRLVCLESGTMIFLSHNSWVTCAQHVVCMRTSANMRAHNSCCATDELICSDNLN